MRVMGVTSPFFGDGERVDVILNPHRSPDGDEAVRRVRHLTIGASEEVARASIRVDDARKSDATPNTLAGQTSVRMLVALISMA